MRQQLAPIYQTRRTRYEIDRCGPQLRAVETGKIRFHALSKGHYPGTRIKPNCLPGVSSIGHWDAREPQDWGLDAHRNEGVEITFLETGVMDFTVEKQHYEVHAGDFTVTRPWQLHRVGGPNLGPGRLHWLILDVGVRRPNQEWRWPAWVTLTPPDCAALSRRLRHNENPVWKSTPEIAAAFRGLAECIRHWQQPHIESRMVNLLNQLLLGLLDAASQRPTDDNPELTSRRRTVELFLRDLADNAASSSAAWTLQKMAAHCGLGITAFSKYCRELVNAGPVEFLNRCRLDQAARLLKSNPALPVTQAAFQTGFNSSQYFATSFRRRFRKTPRAYREAAAS